MNSPIITLGSPIGIGYEIFLLSIQNKTPISEQYVYCIGSQRILNYFIKLLKFEIHYDLADKNNNIISKSNESSFMLINIDEKNNTIDDIFCLSAEEDGEIALKSIIIAAHLIEDGFYSSMVTLPVSKENINIIDPHFKGHTEYLMNLWNEKTVYMTFISEKINILLLTTHIPLSEVPETINKTVIEKGLRYASLLTAKTGIKKNICLLGLNPHAGENGLLGKEELFMKNVVEKLNNEGIPIEGPIPADTAFTKKSIEKYGIFVANYHDQGLIPFKMLSFDTGVNLSFGMKYIRTSVDHGTARDLIGKKQADITSFINAYTLAIKLSS